MDNSEKLATYKPLIFTSNRQNKVSWYPVSYVEQYVMDTGLTQTVPNRKFNQNCPMLVTFCVYIY